MNTSTKLTNSGDGSAIVLNMVFFFTAVRKPQSTSFISLLKNCYYLSEYSDAAFKDWVIICSCKKGVPHVRAINCY